jgi:hypothetical protein
MGATNELDFGGLTLVAAGFKTGATAPGQAGTAQTAAEMALLTGATAANSGTTKAMVTGTSGAVTIAAAGGLSSSVTTVKFNAAPLLVQQVLTTNTAVALTTFNTTIDSTSGALATITLADSTVLGQRKRIQMIVDNGDATVTFNTNATIVFADVGDVAELVWNGADWIPIALYNCADGATAPVYTAAS